MLLPNVPNPTRLDIVPAGPIINIFPGQTIQLQANLTMGALAPIDATRQVDWFVSGATLTITANGRVSAPAAAAPGGPHRVTARRGIVIATVDLNVVAGAPGAAPPPAVLMPAPVIAVNWRPFNKGVPLALVNDMDLISIPNPPALPKFRILRIATFGRGIYPPVDHRSRRVPPDNRRSHRCAISTACR